MRRGMGRGAGAGREDGIPFHPFFHLSATEQVTSQFLSSATLISSSLAGNVVVYNVRSCGWVKGPGSRESCSGLVRRTMR